jgi:CxxC motif-containing protein (DUF1111 family)
MRIRLMSNRLAKAAACAVTLACSGAGDEAPEEVGGAATTSETASALGPSAVGESAGTGFGDPLPGLTVAQKALFLAGLEEFEEEETVEDGLGPVFNDVSCARCHAAPAVGGGDSSVETRFGTRTGGRFDPLTSLGGSLMHAQGIGTFPAHDPTQPACTYAAEVVPAEATLRSGRRTTPLFGLGLVDAVAEDSFRLLARTQAAFFPGQAGRVAVVRDIAAGRDAVGRFGWKAQNPSLFQFAGDAYLNEMGITSPDFPEDNCPQGDCELLARCNPARGVNDDGSAVIGFRDFMLLLGPPPRGTITPSVRRGERVFDAIGCSRCHTPTLVTGRHSVEALSRVAFHPYSDFLLHDMGTLGDGIELGDARGEEFRTAPLWGLRMMTSFLHDGRATSMADAIRAHDGQGRRARDAFGRLSARDRQDLLVFLGSL